MSSRRKWYREAARVAAGVSDPPLYETRPTVPSPSYERTSWSEAPEPDENKTAAILALAESNYDAAVADNPVAPSWDEANRLTRSSYIKVATRQYNARNAQNA
jgi:hypothetical protein